MSAWTASWPTEVGGVAAVDAAVLVRGAIARDDAGQALADVVGEAQLAQLAVVDDVDADFDLASPGLGAGLAGGAGGGGRRGGRRSSPPASRAAPAGAAASRRET